MILQFQLSKFHMNKQINTADFSGFLGLGAFFLLLGKIFEEGECFL